MSPADTIRLACQERRAALIPGAVEKYPDTTVSVRILDAEALLAELSEANNRAGHHLKSRVAAQDRVVELLAVGERDKAEIARLESERRELVRRGQASGQYFLAERERDRRQIAQLTAALEQQDAVIALVTRYVDDLLDRVRDVNGPRKTGSTAGSFALYAESRLNELVKRAAVLADKEDADGL